MVDLAICQPKGYETKPVPPPHAVMCLASSCSLVAKEDTGALKKTRKGRQTPLSNSHVICGASNLRDRRIMVEIMSSDTARACSPRGCSAIAVKAMCPDVPRRP